MASVVAYAAAGVVALALAGAASARTDMVLLLPGADRVTFCIRPDGSLYPPRCMRGKCDCGRDPHVTEFLCTIGEQPAPSTPEANKALYAAAAGGTLDKATYDGRRFCVAQIPPKPSKPSPRSYTPSWDDRMGPWIDSPPTPHP